MQQRRQEVLNVLLARLLQSEGLVVDAEVMLKAAAGGRRAPDVIVDFGGLRVAIEGDFADRAGVEQAVARQAIGRVNEGIAHISVAVLYPGELRDVRFEGAEEALAECQLSFAVVTAARPRAQFSRGTAADLAETLRRVREELGRDEALERAVAVIEAGVEAFASRLGKAQAVVERFAAALGVGGGRAARLNARQKLAVRRVAGLILTNALIFHEVLARHEPEVPPLLQVREGGEMLARLADVWAMVLEEINYYPIFHVALELLRAIASGADVAAAIEQLMQAALRTLEHQAALRHDLMGRIYHRLLSEAKYLGAYYTSIPAATLLLKLALRPGGWPRCDWSNLERLRRFAVADLACGTGTLLMATADAIQDNYIHACAQRGQRPKLDLLHDLLLRDVLWGFDVVASAVHLTASTLALRNPEVMVDETNLYCLQLGGRAPRLGSVDFLDQRKARADAFLFTPAPDAVRASGRGPGAASDVELPRLQLCVMNPPFTRSVGGNLLFGSVPARQRQRMQQKLRTLLRKHRVDASITAGLGAVFVAVADRALDGGGRMALVLPRAVLGGVAWQATRRLLARDYHLEYVVVSHEPGRWNFSENTELSETLLVARKRNENRREGERTVFVNLWRNPRGVVEALALARAITEADEVPGLGPDEGSLTLEMNGLVMGQAVCGVWAELAHDLWSCWCAYAHTDTLRTFHLLRKGLLWVPTKGLVGKVPVRPLGEIGELGPDARDIHDGFRLARTTTHYPALWGHDTAEVVTIAQEPNAWLEPLQQPKPGRPLRDPNLLWARAGRLLLAERLRLNTCRVSAVLAGERVLSNMWWPVQIGGDEERQRAAAQALALWLNCTLGLILLLGYRTETQGAWCKLKKPVAKMMPVLDVLSMSDEQLAFLGEAYEDVAEQPLRPLPEMANDPVRAAIDAAVEEAIGVTGLEIVRRGLSWEPVVSLSMERLLPAGKRRRRRRG